MPAEPAADPAARVLVVDDEPSIGFGLSRTLARRGYAVATAASAAEARREAAAFRPDLVLLDLKLPDGDGLALLAELRGGEPAPRVAVMTGISGAETAEEARARGAARVLVKPIEMDELLRVVAELVRGR